jgi:hypothetical protein
MRSQKYITKMKLLILFVNMFYGRGGKIEEIFKEPRIKEQFIY